ncbi:SDR family NAD(P)-dependent oxidoreductase [Marinobacter sediminum]|nr:SDR family NAD(P)-dependent oxidoreductase [Marinobacter sediminum]
MKNHPGYSLGEQAVAVVTGAAAGIGRATALAFAAKGVRVVVADIHRPESAFSTAWAACISVVS